MIYAELWANGKPFLVHCCGNFIMLDPITNMYHNLEANWSATADPSWAFSSHSPEDYMILDEEQFIDKSMLSAVAECKCDMFTVLLRSGCQCGGK